MRVLIRSQLDTLHTPIVLSKGADAEYSPFGENTTLKTLLEWPVRVLICFQLDTLHTPIVQLSDPDSKYSLFGEHTTLLI